MSRLTNDWLSPITTADQEIRNLHSADFVRVVVSWNATPTTCADFLAGLESNVLGSTGIGLQMKVTENGNRPDALANDLIEQAWKEWSKAANCSINGKFTWFDIQRLALRSTARDGDCIIRMLRNRNGFQLQLLEGDRLDLGLQR